MDNHTKSSKKTNAFKWGCFLLGIIPILVCAWMWIEFQKDLRPSEDVFTVAGNAVGPTPEPCDMGTQGWCVQTNDQRSRVRSDITNAVLFSLAHNRIDSLKPYINESEWAFVDQWMLEHQPVSNRCTFGLDPDFRGSMGAGGRDNMKMWFHYGCPDGYYEMKIDLLFEEHDNQLFVQSIESVCETRLGEHICWRGAY